MINKKGELATDMEKAEVLSKLFASDLRLPCSVISSVSRFL